LIIAPKPPYGIASHGREINVYIEEKLKLNVPDEGWEEGNQKALPYKA
jgi:hypothetical protein